MSRYFPICPVSVDVCDFLSCQGCRENCTDHKACRTKYNQKGCNNCILTLPSLMSWKVGQALTGMV